MLASRAAGGGAGAGSSLAPGASSAVAGVGAARAAGGGTAGVAPPSSPSGSAAGSSAGTWRQPDPPSRTVPSQTSAIAAIGGQPLAGSGFENERSAKGFRPATAAVSSPDSMAPVEEIGYEEAGSAPAAGPDLGLSTVTSLHSGHSLVAAPARVGRWMGMASTAQRIQRVLTRAAYQMNAIRRRVPSDVAPATTPPRMPIDHHED
jgi:hypothetical protein